MAVITFPKAAVKSVLGIRRQLQAFCRNNRRSARGMNKRRTVLGIKNHKMLVFYSVAKIVFYYGQNKMFGVNNRHKRAVIIRKAGKLTKSFRFVSNCGAHFKNSAHVLIADVSAYAFLFVKSSPNKAHYGVFFALAIKKKSSLHHMKSGFPKFFLCSGKHPFRVLKIRCNIVYFKQAWFHIVKNHNIRRQGLHNKSIKNGR